MASSGQCSGYLVSTDEIGGATDFADMKSLFPATDKVGQHHVFDIGSNKIRLIAVVHYKFKKVYIQRIMDHAEYDKGVWKG